MKTTNRIFPALILSLLTSATTTMALPFPIHQGVLTGPLNANGHAITNVAGVTFADGTVQSTAVSGAITNGNGADVTLKGNLTIGNPSTSNYYAFTDYGELVVNSDAQLDGGWIWTDALGHMTMQGLTIGGEGGTDGSWPTGLTNNGMSQLSGNVQIIGTLAIQSNTAAILRPAGYNCFYQSNNDLYWVTPYKTNLIVPGQ